jgi:4-carboxymuconolactone decarboxylase
MATTTVRVPPIEEDALTEAQKQLIGGWTDMIFCRVLAHHPRIYSAFVPFLGEVITRTSLPPRDREIICLRMLHLGGDTYESTHHKTIALRSGMTKEEIDDASDGSGVSLGDFDRTLVRATEELHRDQCIADATWAALAQRYSQEQLMELVFLAGCYMTMAMITNSFGMPLETPETFEALEARRTYV